MSADSPTAAASRLALRYLIAVLLVIVFLFPIYWLFMISFKTPEEIFAYPPVWYPTSLQARQLYRCCSRTAMRPRSGTAWSSPAPAR